MGISKKIFSNDVPGLDRDLTLCTGRELKTWEVSNLNSKLRTEKQKSPDLKITGLVSDSKTGSLDVSWIYRPKPKRTISDKIDGIIDSAKKGKIRPSRR
jgi:hypothetical protein